MKRFNEHISVGCNRHRPPETHPPQTHDPRAEEALQSSLFSLPLAIDDDSLTSDILWSHSIYTSWDRISWCHEEHWLVSTWLVNEVQSNWLGIARNNSTSTRDIITIFKEHCSRRTMENQLIARGVSGKLKLPPKSIFRHKFSSSSSSSDEKDALNYNNAQQIE